MKHLKIFENHNPYYQSISKDEYTSSVYVRENWEEFTPEEIISIQEIFPDILFGFSVKKYGIEINLSEINWWHITKLKDEWYYPYEKYRGHYKCDQLEGLLVFLKDIKNESDRNG